jgi:hypothetical protein
MEAYRVSLAAFAVVAMAGVARAQEAGAQGDVLMQSESFAEAGAAYRRAFDDTHDPTFLKKAAQAYLKLGPEGRAQALDAATLYSRQARTIEEARDSQALLAQVQAVPVPLAASPAPPPPAPPPPVVVAPAVPPPAAVAVTPPATTPDPAGVELWDVLYLNDGGVVRGLLASTTKGQYSVTLPGGAVAVVLADNVREIKKERNPNYEPRAVESAAPEAFAGPGFRFGAASGVALPIGRFDDTLVGPRASFEVAARIGWELIWDRVGFSPAVRVEYVRWANDLDAAYDFLHIGADLRLAGHVGRVVPHLSVCPGGDLSYPASLDSAKGFGLDIGAGMDVLLTRHASAGFGIRVHPGFTDVFDGSGGTNVSYLAFQAGFGIY